MRATVVLIWLLASTFALSVKSKPHGKQKTSHTANNEKDVLSEETNEGQVLPTFIPVEASSHEEQEDEEMSSEDNTNTSADKATGVSEVSEGNDKSSPVLLSEEELVDLLKEELKESEEEVAEEEEETAEDGESGEGGEKADKEKTQAEEAGDDAESEEDAEQEETGDVEEASEGKDTKLSDKVVEKDVKEENEKETEKEEERVAGEEATSVEANKGDSVTAAEASDVEETDGSTASEIPATDLDYVADSDSSQPLQTEPQADNPLSKADVTDVKAEDDKVTDEKAAAADDYEQDFQNTEASESGEDVAVVDQGKEETKPESDFQEPKSSVVELNAGPRLTGKEDAAKDENGNNDSAVHAKGKKRKHKKNQRVRKHHMQRDEGQLPGHGQVQEDTEGRNIDNAVHKAKRRRAGKWATLVGMNPVQIRATVDLYPSARPSIVGGIHRPEAPADPCDNFRCKRGKTCKLDENNKPSCVCRQPSECPPSVNEFDNVCGTDNNTYDTSCELFATKCNLEGTKKGHRLHLDYTGPCKFIAPCLDTELVQFPLRMRDWLKNVLLQLYEHDSMSPGFLTSKQRGRVRKIYENERRLHAGDHTLELLAQDFEKNYHMYIYPVHWQFAQIDQHPADRFLSHSELAPLRVPLVPMEHCTSRFFQECDADKDKQVSFQEWTQCFGIKDEDMDVNLLF